MQQELQTFMIQLASIVVTLDSHTKTDPELPPVASKPYPLLLKHHEFVKEETENILEAG